MTSPLFTRYRSTWVKSTWTKAALAALAASACACTSVQKVMYPATDGKPETVLEERRQEKLISSQFEWAVQNYEAGQYDKAIAEFKRLLTQGAEVPSFELVPFYLGMSYYRTKRDAEAAQYLESFLRKNGPISEQQEARLTLLLTYERQGAWDKLLALASETDKLNLFQENRALLRLLWARALVAKGELKGARAVLKESEPFLDVIESTDGYLHPEPNADLVGRKSYTSVLLKTAECERRNPREVKQGKRTKRLYANWLEDVGTCLREATSEGIELVRSESLWTQPALERLGASFEEFTAKIRSYQQKESGQLAEKNGLRIAARRQLYRLLGPIDDSLKNLQNQGLAVDSLNQLRKRTDALLVSLSASSS